MENQEVHDHIPSSLSGRHMRPLPRRAQGGNLHTLAFAAVEASRTLDNTAVYTAPVLHPPHTVHNVGRTIYGSSTHFEGSISLDATARKIDTKYRSVNRYISDAEAGEEWEDSAGYVDTSGHGMCRARSASWRGSDERSIKLPSSAVRLESLIASDPSLSASASSSSDLGLAMHLLKLPGLSGPSSFASGTSSFGSGWLHEDEKVAEPVSDQQGPRSKRQNSFEVERRSLDLSELWSPVANKFQYEDEDEYDAQEEREEDEDEDDGTLSPLERHCEVLPPSSAATKNLDDFPSCLSDGTTGHILSLRKIRYLSGGNGTTSLEVVESRNQLWVLKKCVPVREGKSFEVSDLPRLSDKVKSALRQLKREVDIYRRIEEAPKRTKDGFQFIMTAGAGLTLEEDYENGRASERSIGGQFGLLLPLMSTDLWDHLSDLEGMLLPRDDTKRILAQASIGIATLHSVGVIHLDFKPENIFLDARGNVKIGDFGLSKMSDTLKPSIAGKGYAQGVAGTRGFWAPEVVRGDKYGIEADYWSLGCVLVELVTGETVNKFNFDKEASLLEWAARYRRVSQRRKYFLAQLNELRPDDPALDLLCRLLDPRLQSRAGIAAMLVHDFFNREDGLSEFSQMREKAQTRPVAEVALSTSKTGASPEIYYASAPSDNSQFRWINPSHESDLIETST